MKFANVIVDISMEKLDKTFQYRIPQFLNEMVKVGSRVEVPFGRGNRIISGYVLEITNKPELNESKLKDIKGVIKNSQIIESQLIELASWIKEYYGSTMNKALKTVIPVKKAVKSNEIKYIKLKVSVDKCLELIDYYKIKKNTEKRAVLLENLRDNNSLEYDYVVNTLLISRNIIMAMEKLGIIIIDRSISYRIPFKENITDEYNVVLNNIQVETVESIMSNLEKTHLIYGVTGSGKTEVYMELINRTILNNKQAIVLIPEIALTFQTIKRFYQRFGNIVSIINSKLSAGEKFDQFERAKNGEISIMIGPRSALFTPFKKLGLIIIDEEHEGAYKSDQVPKYHARQTAIHRAKLSGATVVLGSATPSVESYYKALNGEYILHKIENRANNLALPFVHVVDLKEEFQSGNKDILSDKLKSLIEDRLKKKEQIILFINRRGYSTFISCRECGKAVKCPHCDVSLTFHKKNSYNSQDKLVCHYCGYSILVPKICPKCSSKYLGRFGIGTEQVEGKINELYPMAKTLRMDYDTTREKGNYEAILNAFSENEADILIGTQMIVKGHDFPNVTLVGVIAADLSLFSSDYMASERTFQLLTQAAGRAGRGSKPGEVVIQTYNPEEISIITATNQDYEAFYNNEIKYRELMAYPPVYSMVAIIVSDKSETIANMVINDISKRISKSNIEGLMVIGPSKASVSKINDIYRYVVYLKHSDYNILVNVKNRIQAYINLVEEYKKISIQFDFTPMTNY